jgi:hypothetical protein
MGIHPWRQRVFVDLCHAVRMSQGCAECTSEVGNSWLPPRCMVMIRNHSVVFERMPLGHLVAPADVQPRDERGHVCGPTSFVSE